MHIPQGPTAALALELFDDALAAALRPSPDYDVSRWLYVPNHYSEYRYILGTRGRKPLICIRFCGLSNEWQISLHQAGSHSGISTFKLLYKLLLFCRVHWTDRCNFI